MDKGSPVLKNYKMESTIIMIISLTAISFGQFVNYGPLAPVALNNDVSFSRNFGVHFHPPLVKPATPFTRDYQEIIPFLEKVQARFSAISVEHYTKATFENGYVEIYTPLAAAQLNARQANRSLEGSNGRKLKVYLSFSMDLPSDFEAVKRGNRRSVFDLTKQIADQANEMHNGTVEHLIMELQNENSINFDIVAEQLMTARNKSSTGTWKYKLGVAFQMDRCVELASVLGKDTRRLFSMVDFSLFSNAILERHLKVPIGTFSRCLLRKMEKCQAVLSQKQPRLEVAFFTMWPGNTDRDMVWFWLFLNKWVKRANSTVFLVEAFDTPGRASSTTLFDALGWWRIDRRNEITGGKKSQSYLTITEKRSLLTPDSIQNSDNMSYCMKRKTNENLTNAQCPYDSVMSPQGPASAKDITGSKMSVFKHSRFGVYFAAQFQHPELKNVFYEDDYMPLLELVRSRFSNIMVAPVSATSIEYGSSTINIPTAAAKLNLARHQNLSKSDSTRKDDEDWNYLRLFLIYDDAIYRINLGEKLKNLERTSFDLTIQLAEEANSIFKNTVEHLAVRVSDLVDFHPIAQLEYSSWRLWRMSQKTGKNDSSAAFSYKLGIIVDLKFCGGSSSTVVEYLEYLLKFVSFVVFESPVDKVDLNGREDTLREYQAKLEFCLRKMRKFFFHIEAMFSSWLPDATADSTGKTNDTQRAWVWEAMSHWAKKTNTTVIMYEAFDNLATGNKFSTQSSSLGWWRYEENCPCVKSTTEYRFVEKRKLEGCSRQNNTMYKDLNMLVHKTEVTDMSLKEFTYEGYNQTVPSFNRPQFGVSLDFDNSHHTDYSAGESTVFSVIRMVHSRFSKMILKPIQEGNVLYKERYTTIPKRAAEYNRAKESSEKTGTNIDPVEIIMTFSMEYTPPLWKTEESVNQTSFDVVLKLANEVNVIYPETVKMLMLQYNWLNVDNVNMEVEQLKIFQRKVDTGPNPYKIGIVLSSASCRVSEEEEFENTYLSKILPHVKVAYFTYWTTQFDWDMGADISFKRITDAFLVCKERALKIFPDLEVGLYTSWSDTDEDEKENLTELVNYWGKMNRFSRNANATLILSKALDGIDDTTGQVQHTGWWRRRRDNVTDLNEGSQKIGVFEEKYHIVRFKKDLVNF